MSDKRFVIVYASKYGQTEKIVRKLGNVLRAAGSVDVRLVDQIGLDFHPARYQGAIIAGSVYFGKHQKSIRDFVRMHMILLSTVPAAFVSVSGAAGGTSEPARKQADEYVRQFLDETGWVPRASVAFGGGVPYTRYGFFTKWFMKRDAKKRGEIHDTSRDYESTDWDAVEKFGEGFLKLLDRPSSPASR